MTNNEKLEALKVWLTENGYKFTENHQLKKVTADLFVIKPYVAVKIGDDEYFFHKTKHFASPFFIRDDESVAFIIEKMGNCLVEAKKKHKEAIERKKLHDAIAKANIEKKQREHEEAVARKKAKEEAKKAAEKPKRKRQRIMRVEKV